MIPRLDIRFPLKRQWQYWFGKEYVPAENELLLNHARSGIVLALRTTLPNGGRVGVVTYNCHTVANAVISANCTPVFLDVDNNLRINLHRGLHRGTVPVCKSGNLDAIVVTNLFGIQNDIAAIRKACPQAIIIVDNAHGYGLPPEGDFTVYSINQGKYPALGPGGILVINNPKFTQWCQTPLCNFSFIQQMKEFASMLIKAILYHPFIYGWFTMRLKAGRANNADHTPVVIKAMSPGVSRMYRVWVDKHKGLQLSKPFMDIVRTDDPAKTIAEYKAQGIEADTHFKNCIRWAKEFGYIEGTCPNAERLVDHLVMVPNYYKK